MTGDSITSCSGTTPSLDSGLWTARQVADFIKCSVSYVYKAAERDLLPTVHIGRMLRFRPEDVRAFVTRAATC